MANITYGSALGDYGTVSSHFTGKLKFDGLITDSKTHKVVGATYLDSATGTEIELHGTNLTFSKQHIPTGGVVTDVDVTDGHSHPYLTVDHAKFDAKSLIATALASGVDAAVQMALTGKNNVIGSAHSDYIISGEGNDTIKSGRGDDWLIPGGGNDHLIGGSGSDVFFFGHDFAHDTIDHYEIGVDKLGILTTDKVFYHNTAEGLIVQFEKYNAHHGADDTLLVAGVHKVSDLDFYTAF